VFQSKFKPNSKQNQSEFKAATAKYKCNRVKNWYWRKFAGSV